MRVSEKTTENPELLDRQARPGFEPATSRLSILSVIAMRLVDFTPAKKYPITESSVHETLKYKVVFTQIKYFFKPSSLFLWNMTYFF